MYKYETIVVISPKLDDAALEARVAKFRQIIEGTGSTVDAIESWGKREIAQTLNNEAYGYYVCFNYTGSNHQAITTVNQQFRLDSDVLKFQNHKIGESTKKYKVNRRFQSLGDDYTIGG